MTAKTEAKLKFDGSSGQLPSAEARRYVYRVLASCLEDDVQHAAEGWVFGGLENEFDRRRAKRAAELVIKELRKKGAK